MLQLFRKRPALVLAIILANVGLSAWGIYSDPVINNDGVTYLALAEYMRLGDWGAAFDFYSWPYYSVFIMLTAKLLWLDTESAAYVLNTFFATSLTLAFVGIVAELSSQNRRLILLAAIIILLFPSINKYRSFIIRDFGYLSCYLWSLYYIFRFCRSFHKRHLAGWLLFAGLSFLFRFEGIVFLLIAPYFLLLFGATNLPHRRKILSILSALLVCASSLLVFWYVNDKYAAMLEMAARTGSDIGGVADLFLANLNQRIGDQPLGVSNFLRVFFASVGIVLYELLRRMAVLYFIFSGYAWLKRLVLREDLQRKVWLVFVATNLMVLIGFSLYNSFLVSRYTLATALTLLVLAPSGIDHLWQQAWSRGSLSRCMAVILAIILLGISLDRFTQTTNKMHLKQAGQWLAKHAQLEDRIYSNDKLIVYYANRSPKENLEYLYSTDVLLEFQNTNQLRNFDYIAFELDNTVYREQLLRQTLTYHWGDPVHMLAAGDQKWVFIFATKRLQK